MTFYDCGYLLSYCFEQLLTLIVNYPGVDYCLVAKNWSYITEYQLSMLISLFQFFKLNVFFQLLEFRSPYTNATATRICENNGAKANFMFAVKVYSISCPYKVLVIFFAVGILSFGMVILMFEYTVNTSDIN